eukprot:scaffold232114_cov27-Tisochrysis_lutea.AAC.1
MMRILSSTRCERGESANRRQWLTSVTHYTSHYMARLSCGVPVHSALLLARDLLEIMEQPEGNA